jgi:hypothetical protein
MAEPSFEPATPARQMGLVRRGFWGLERVSATLNASEVPFEKLVPLALQIVVFWPEFALSRP